jgi:TonB family protein
MRQTLLTSISILLLALTAAAQNTATWYRVTPEGEEFSVLMPDFPLRVRRELPIAENTKLTPPSFELVSGGILYAVFSIEKSKLAPAQITGEGFVNSFSYSVAHNPVSADGSLIFERSLRLDKLTVKQFALHAGGYEGTARIYETPIHYYVLMTLGSKAGEISADNFFNSFILSTENVSQNSNKVPFDERAQSPSSSTPKPLWTVAGSQQVLGVSSSTENRTDTIKDSGRILTGHMLTKPQPEYPPIARAARAQGAVVVAIVVDEEGYIIATNAVSGHPLLQAAAVRVARQARFSPTTLDGKPVKVAGTLTYNFTLQ